jgi:hypothetical protein
MWHGDSSGSFVGQSAWELDCHALIDWFVAGQSSFWIVRQYPPCTCSAFRVGHVAGTARPAVNADKRQCMVCLLRTVSKDELLAVGQALT